MASQVKKYNLNPTLWKEGAPVVKQPGETQGAANKRGISDWGSNFRKTIGDQEQARANARATQGFSSSLAPAIPKPPAGTGASKDRQDKAKAAQQPAGQAPNAEGYFTGTLLPQIGKDVAGLFLPEPRPYPGKRNAPPPTPPVAGAPTPPAAGAPPAPGQPAPAGVPGTAVAAPAPGQPASIGMPGIGSGLPPDSEGNQQGIWGARPSSTQNSLGIPGGAFNRDASGQLGGGSFSVAAGPRGGISDADWNKMTQEQRVAVRVGEQNKQLQNIINDRESAAYTAYKQGGPLTNFARDYMLKESGGAPVAGAEMGSEAWRAANPDLAPERFKVLEPAGGGGYTGPGGSWQDAATQTRAAQWQAEGDRWYQDMQAKNAIANLPRKRRQAAWDAYNQSQNALESAKARSAADLGGSIANANAQVQKAGITAAGNQQGKVLEYGLKDQNAAMESQRQAYRDDRNKRLQFMLDERANMSKADRDKLNARGKDVYAAIDKAFDVKNAAIGDEDANTLIMRNAIASGLAEDLMKADTANIIGVGALKAAVLGAAAKLKPDGSNLEQIKQEIMARFGFAAAPTAAPPI